MPSSRSESGARPGLATVLVGEDPASAVYVRSKNRATAEAGMVGFAHNLPDTTTEAELLDLVGELNADEQVDGILVQLPLPAQIDATRVIETIEPGKDVDGFHPINVGRVAAGLDALVPCTPLGCLHLIKSRLGSDIAGLDAVVIGRSNIVGKPMALLLLRRERDRDRRPFADARPARQSCAARTSSLPPPAGPKWSAATGSSPERR